MTSEQGIASPSAFLGLRPGPVDLDMHAPRRTPGFDGDKADGKAALESMRREMRDLQAKLAAHGYTGGERSVLLVLQGMDTSGKGGVLKHAAGLLDPGGLRVTAFGAPTEEELAHDFLWRIEKHAPQPGQIAIFDRSHYEDVLIAKVHGLAPEEEIERRYDAINDFEHGLVEAGTVVIKCMLHISPDKQRERLLDRLDKPHKQWKFTPQDVDERKLWGDYQHAYEVALERCNTEWAPWHVVPSDRKWYRNLAITSLLRETLDALDLQWPEPDYDVEEQRKRLVAADVDHN